MPDTRKLESMTEPELDGLMRFTAQAVEEAFRTADIEKPRFVLLVFNDPSSARYISNCERAEMIETMRQTADLLERKQDARRKG